MMSVSVISLYTCSLSSAFALPLCTHNPEPQLLRLNLRLLLCVNAGNPVKSITIIVVPKAPWRPEDAVHHGTASIFQLNLFFFFFFIPSPPLKASSSPVVMDLWKCCR